MTPLEVLAIFERLSLEGRADVDRDETVAGFAGWMVEVWEHLDNDDIALLNSVGATLWREGSAVQH